MAGLSFVRRVVEQGTTRCDLSHLLVCCYIWKFYSRNITSYPPDVELGPALLLEAVARVAEL